MNIDDKQYGDEDQEDIIESIEDMYLADLASMYHYVWLKRTPDEHNYMIHVSPDCCENISFTGVLDQEGFDNMRAFCSMFLAQAERLEASDA